MPTIEVAIDLASREAGANAAASQGPERDGRSGSPRRRRVARKQLLWWGQLLPRSRSRVDRSCLALSRGRPARSAWPLSQPHALSGKDRRPSKAGVFEAFFDTRASMSSSAHLIQIFDSTIVRAHVSAAGATGGQEGQALGRSRGGWTGIRPASFRNSARHRARHSAARHHWRQKLRQQGQPRGGKETRHRARECDAIGQVATFASNIRQLDRLP